MVAMNFVSATDRLTGGPTLETVAHELGVSHSLVRACRLDTASPNFRTPPEQWKAAVARLARKRIVELAKLAETLEREAGN